MRGITSDSRSWSCTRQSRQHYPGTTTVSSGIARDDTCCCFRLMRAKRPLRIVSLMARDATPGGPIPFTLPTLEGSEEIYMTQALEHSRLSGAAPFTKRCHAFLEESLGVRKALLTTSCTSALEMSA